MSKSVTIRMKDQGRDCWHIVEVPPLKFPLLKRLKEGEKLDVRTLGTVIESGWGEPPRDVDHEMIDA